MIHSRMTDWSYEMIDAQIIHLMNGWIKSKNKSKYHELMIIRFTERINNRCDKMNKKWINQGQFLQFCSQSERLKLSEYCFKSNKSSRKSLKFLSKSFKNIFF